MGTYEALLEAQRQRQKQPSTVGRSKQRQTNRSTTRSSDASVPRHGEGSTDRSTNQATRRVATPTPTPTTPKLRALQRRSFEFYVDQLETLRLWSLQAQMRGEKTSMSEMIRSALDSYLEGQRNARTSAHDPTTRPSDASTG